MRFDMETPKADTGRNPLIPQHPDRVAPFLGKAGLPSPYCDQTGPLGDAVAGLDFWQANNFIVHREETAEFLYDGYTETTVTVPSGTLPSYKALAEGARTSADTDTQVALSLLRDVLPGALAHPTIPPFGRMCALDRALDDEALLRTGVGWCNEQARVFVRLCQVRGIPARLIFLFYSDRKAGHVVAEFYADGRWCFADSSMFCAVPGPGGRLLSAAECHNPEFRRSVGAAFRHRVEQLLAMSDEELVGGKFPVEKPGREASIRRESDGVREHLAGWDAEFLGALHWRFGVVNYPLPAR